MEILASIVGNIFPSVLVEYWNYHREADQHVNNLKRKLELLEGRRDDKKKILGSELRQGKKPKNEVKTWLRNVRTIKGDIDIGQVPARWMFFSRMQKGESAFKKIKDVEELYQVGDFTDGLVLDLPDSVSFEASPANEDEEKRKARLMRKRERAQLSRQRKKLYVKELEDKVRSMHSTIAELKAENTTLRQQSSGNVQPLLPHSGMFPHPAMAPILYTWMPPCAPYVEKQQGSQVPLVPIPRLKPQQPVPAPKVKKSVNRKSKGKTKKVASVSFLGLLFFVMLCGGLVPFVNVRYGGIGDKVRGGVGYVSDRFYDRQLGRVLSASEYSNGSRGSVGGGFSSGEFDNSNRVNYVRGRVRIEEYERKGQGLQPLPGSDESMASQAEPEKKDNKEAGLAIRRDLARALATPEIRGNRGRHSHVYRNPTGGQKAFASGSADTLKDNLKSTPADGQLQQWSHVELYGVGSGLLPPETRPDNNWVYKGETGPNPKWTCLGLGRVVMNWVLYFFFLFFSFFFFFFFFFFCIFCFSYLFGGETVKVLKKH